MEEKRMVTDSEWKIMELLWNSEGLTMPQITRALSAETGWSNHTVVSLLKRMCKKGSAEIVPDTSPMVYRAKLNRSDALQQETHSIVRKAFGGKSSLLINCLIEQNDLTDDELNDLMRLLSERRK